MHLNQDIFTRLSFDQLYPEDAHNHKREQGRKMCSPIFQRFPDSGLTKSDEEFNALDHFCNSIHIIAVSEIRLHEHQDSTRAFLGQDGVERSSLCNVYHVIFYGDKDENR
jgi:hypothetical protein